LPTTGRAQLFAAPGFSFPAAMNAAQFEDLLALRHKRRLTPAEQARLDQWLAAHPADRVRWQTESALARALGTSPAPLASSNFMARVWHGIEASERAGALNASRGWFRWPSLAQQFAALTVICALTALVLQGRRQRSPAQVARSVEQVATLARVPDFAVLKDFEAIRRLNAVSADVELLAALEGDR
jgi:hypothetical protein